KTNLFIQELPFTLTDGQSKALSEILVDMSTNIQMNRLLQGDVGSGKTAVASICLYAATTASLQGAFMVPTEILAEQHYESMKKMFQNKLNIGLLTSSIKGNQRKELLQKIKENKIH